MFFIIQNLEIFLRNHHCESILFEEKRNKCLSEEATEFLVEHLRDFIYHEYSFNPSPNDLVQVCEGAVELFPSLASENGNKIVRNIFLCPQNNLIHFVLQMIFLGYFI